MDMVNKCQCGFETPLAKCPKCGVALVPPPIPKGAMPKNPIGISGVILGAVIGCAIVLVGAFLFTAAFMANSPALGEATDSMKDMANAMDKSIEAERAMNEAVENYRLVLPSKPAVK